ncbi:MAG TPA: guanitoxin biosynthesis pre-guanitoxin forming N-methyltransferase GntF [Blastocatellia bacterium]|nr:guanitoxin biosynthesis pre-guanitoxin forming N-methyltransferase GntF [Blastocatellia bacterium]
MPSLLNIAAWESWRPADYFCDYYSHQVEPDEQAAIRFQIEFLRRAGRVFPRALEYGCGPTLMRAIAASRYVEALDMADHLDGNLHQVNRWASGNPQADDWSRFTEYVLRCEGAAEPSQEETLARELRTRQTLAEFLRTDARDPYPLGPDRVANYDLLISGFCLDCLSQSKAVWRNCMRNVFGLLKPGGSFVILALRGCEGYLVGPNWFPAANIQLVDLESALLECGADPAGLEVAESDLPSHASQGYQGILMASGQTLAHLNDSNQLT